MVRIPVEIVEHIKDGEAVIVLWEWIHSMGKWVVHCSSFSISLSVLMTCSYESVIRLYSCGSLSAGSSM